MRSNLWSIFGLSFAFFVALLGLCGCGTPGPKTTASLEDVLVRDASAKKDIDEINQRVFASVASTPSMEDYVISEGDLLQVTVFEAEELTSEARVGARGHVTLPLIGSIEVQGISAREAEQKIEDAYRQRYIRDPHINIFVKEQYGSKITLVGELEKPGTYDYFGRQRLLDVLALAEGLTENAGRTVQVRRVVDEQKPPETFFIDLDEMVKEGHSDLNIPIEGGDVIYVPEGGTVYVDGAVSKSGAYPIKQNMTVQEAIVAAGGYSSAASDTVKLVRHTDAGKRDVIQLSAKDIDSTNFSIQDRDIVFVETNPVKAAVYGFRLQLFGTGVAISPPK